MAERITNDDIIKSLLNEAFYRSSGETSLSDIAGNLSIKKASLYNHFASREEIIAKAFERCAEYLSEIYFTPPNVEEVAKKYSPETVLKGSVNRYFKMHEKEPLFQIYTFVESNKYFSSTARKIVEDEKQKLTLQTIHLLEIFCTLDKISIKREQVSSAAVWFVSGLDDLLNCYLLKKKEALVKNPDAGQGSLFELPDDQSELQKVNSFVEQFVTLLK